MPTVCHFYEFTTDTEVLLEVPGQWSDMLQKTCLEVQPTEGVGGSHPTGMNRRVCAEGANGRAQFHCGTSSLKWSWTSGKSTGITHGWCISVS